jgi:hypothetical protein
MLRATNELTTRAMVFGVQTNVNRNLAQRYILVDVDAACRGHDPNCNRGARYKIGTSRFINNSGKLN